MRITVNPTFDIETWALDSCDAVYDYAGPVELAKGDASKAEQASADAQRAQQNALMQKNLEMQQNQINMVNPTLQSIIGNRGLLPEQEAALRATYMNQLPNTLRQGMGAINQNLVARGLTGGQTGAGGGGVAGDFGQLTAMLGTLQQQGETGTQLTKMQGLNNAMNTALGIGGMYGQNIGTFNQGASSALNSGVTAANNVDQAATSWMGPVFGALGNIGGSFATGGLSSLTKKPCWIAAACFDGFDDVRVKFIRKRLWHRAESEFVFKVIINIYIAIGESVAKLVNKSSWLKSKFIKIFTRFILGELDSILNDAVNG